MKDGWREKMELATKFGVQYIDGKVIIHGDPSYVRAACEGSLKRLGIDYIDLYYQHRIDTKFPLKSRFVHLLPILSLYVKIGL